MKIILRLLAIFFLILIIAIAYLSTVGVETSRFNKQIASSVKNFNNDLEIELQSVKIILDPFNLEFNAKTVGPKIKLKDKKIELESIKTKIIIDTFFNNDFSLKNIDISTRSLEITNLISFTRNIKNTSELYILEKIVKKGFLICDVKLEFDKEGKIKKNYTINGLIKNAQLKFLKKNNFDKINFGFKFQEEIFELEDLELSLNNTFLQSERVIIKKDTDKKFYVEGSAQADNLSLKDELFVTYLRNYIPKFDLINFDLNSKNKFSFKIDKKYRVNDLKLSSEVKIINLRLKNDLELISFLPDLKKEININNHLLNIDYKKDVLFINGKGDIFFQEKKDFISYDILKKKDNLDFKVNLIVDKNPISINFLSYKKKPDLKAEINLIGSHRNDNKTIIKSFLYNEGKNRIEANQISLNKNLKLDSLKEIKLVIID